MNYTAIAFTDDGSGDDFPQKIGEAGATILATLLHRLEREGVPLAIIFHEGKPYSTWRHPDCEEVY